MIIVACPYSQKVESASSLTVRIKQTIPEHAGALATPVGQKYAQRVQAEEMVQRWGLPVSTTAVDALVAELNRTFGRVLWLTAKVETLDEEALETSPWPGLERWERRHLTGLAARMVGLDLDGRQVAIVELLGARLADGLDRALAGAGVPIGQRARVLELLPGALGGGGALPAHRDGSCPGVGRGPTTGASCSRRSATAD